ncbi:hypothetical protein ACSQ67_004857 [Phaseolus vulgaris]
MSWVENLVSGQRKVLLASSYVHGSPLLESSTAFKSKGCAERTSEALGRVLMLDLVIRNEDRLPCRDLRWRGNPANLLLAGKIICANTDVLKAAVDSAIDRYKPKMTWALQKERRSTSVECRLDSHDPGLISQSSDLSDITEFPISLDMNLIGQTSEESMSTDISIVAIDSCVPRRPPAGKRANDQVNYPKLIELLINSSEFASNLIYDVTGGKLGCPPQEDMDKTDNDVMSVVHAFRTGFRAALRDLQGFHIFLLTLHQRLDTLLRQFMNISSKISLGEFDKEDTVVPDSPSLASGGIVPLHHARRGLVDAECSKELEQWNEMLKSDAIKLCQENNFNPGFFEGDNNCVIDAYELKIRLEHILERIGLISDAASTEKPSAVTSSLFIGGALAARSVHTLQYLGITNILCLCTNEIGQSETQYHDLFVYKNFSVCDSDDYNISSIFEEACDFIDYVEQTGQRVLVHCFEGKSRSVTLVLAYLMLRKEYTLSEAWQALKRVHCRAQPNDGFAKILLELDQKLYGKVSMEWLQRKPMMKVCPICGKNAGLSSSSLKLHLQKSHRKLSSGSVDSAMTMEIQKALTALKISRGGSVSPTQR